MKRGNTAERIAGAARALLDRSGAEAVTMREVAAAVRITPMAIYRHHRDRDALLAALADEDFSRLAARLERRGRRARSPRAELAALFDGYLEFADRYPHRFELMFARAHRAARRWPDDFAAGRSPTGNLVLAAVARALPDTRRAVVLEASLALWAEAHGLIALSRAGRLGTSRADFRRLYRRLIERVLDGYR